jgi:hypothetical protein
MRAFLAIALIAALATTRTTFAAPDDAQEIRELRAQIDALNARLQALEQRAGLAPAVPSGSSGQIAEHTVAPAAESWPVPGLPGLSVKGDMRVRYERFDREPLPDRDRARMRARLALTATPTEDIDVTIGIASGGDDPRSANSTFGSTFTRKDIGLDLASVRWHPTDELDVYAGKMKYPAFKPAFTTFVDGDLNPEGFAAGWRSGTSGVFANAFGFWIEERGADVDSMWYSGQLGWRATPDEGISVTAVATYQDFANVEGQQPFYLGQAFGNSVDADRNLIYDYDIGQIAVELGLGLGGLPFTIFGEYGRNFAADDMDTAWSLGVLLGKASAPGTWEVGYAYADTEKDALFAQVIESDFADGRTDARGHFVRAGYAIAKNWTANLQLYLNDLDVSGRGLRFDRLQVDLNWKY